MTTKERIEKDYIAEVKARNASAVSTLRMLRAALKNAEIDKRGPLDEAETISAVSKEVKKLKDSLDSFVAGKREDLAAQARQEIALLENYLPKQLSEDEIRAAVRSAITASGAQGPKDMGKVIGLVVKETQGGAPGNVISAIVKEELARPPS